MHLTTYSDYSLRVLIYLAAAPGRHVSTQEISQSFAISHHHLVKVVHQLGRKGFLTIRRGRHGGISLERAPELISIGQVVRAMEPDFHLAECFDDSTNGCPLTAACGLKGALFQAQCAFFKVLDRYTLASVMNESMRKILLPTQPRLPGSRADLSV